MTFLGFAFIWLFKNHSNKIAEQLSTEFTTFSGVALDTKRALSSA